MYLSKLKALYEVAPSVVRPIAFLGARAIGPAEYLGWRRRLAAEGTAARDRRMDVLRFCVEAVPYYRDRSVYSNVLELMRAGAMESWWDLPLIDKNTVKKNFDEFVSSRSTAKNRFLVSTGGTSGESMVFLQSNNVWFKELAFVDWYYNKHCNRGTRASFRGTAALEKKRGLLWVDNPVHREVIFSPFGISAKNAERYYEHLQLLKPAVLTGYPSALLEVGRVMSDMGFDTQSLVSRVVLISENFDDGDIKSLKELFGASVTSFYGHSERCLFGVSLGEGLDSYSMMDSYGHAELVDPSGVGLSSPNVKGQLVGTSYDNYAMPLIRYATGDYAEYISRELSEMTRICGRWDGSYIIGSGGENISVTSLNLHSDSLKNVVQYQFVQREKGNCTVQLLVMPDFDGSDFENIGALLKRKVGDAVNFVVVVVPSLTRTSRGKVPFLISDISCKK